VFRGLLLLLRLVRVVLGLLSVLVVVAESSEVLNGWMARDMRWWDRGGREQSGQEKEKKTKIEMTKSPCFLS
jgi:hypothetical protein